jgi:uncharacterized cupredoxin-like copper-binding protein
MKLAIPLLLAACAIAHAAPVQKAFGIAGDASKATRTVNVDLRDDMRFTPPALDLNRGETVRFVVSNKGATLHEMVLGTREDNAKHAEAMRTHAHHNMSHAAPGMIALEPGNTGEIVWQFNRAGTFEYACLVPGHYEAGMRGTITVK